MTNKYPCGEVCVDAKYSQPLQSLHVGNPVIEALPEVIPVECIYNQLFQPIPYNESERNLLSYERAECIPALYQVFQPYGMHIELAKKFSMAIRSGYIGRNPLSIEQTKTLNLLGECVQTKDSNFNRFLPTNTGASGFSIIGPSGTGKSCSIQRVLSRYPQLILHSEYNGKPFNYTQIVWMKLDCPHDGSIKGLCMNFFQEFDRLTGDNTYYKFASGSRATTDSMIPQMALLARRHSLGVLVIDEVEFISAAKSGGVERMLNFIISLVNKIGVPIVLVGIPAAMSVLSSNLMNARRNAGEQGSIMIKNLQYGSIDWDTFINGIWKYQWTSQKTELLPELSKAICNGSYGIVDVAVKLYVQAQQTSIRVSETSGRPETIDLTLINHVINSDNFKLIRDFMCNMKNEPSADADLKFISWDKIKEKDTKPVLPKRSSQSDIEEKRNDVLQLQVSIPRINNEMSNLVTPDDVIGLIKNKNQGDV